MLPSVIETTSNELLTCWAHVALPYSESHKLPPYLRFTPNGTSLRLRAYRRMIVGTQTEIWSIYGSWQPNQKLEGEFSLLTQDESDFEEKNKDIILTDWVSANPIKLIPQPVITLSDGRTVKPAVDTRRTVVREISKAAMGFDVQFVPFQGILFQCDGTIYGEQDHVEFDLTYHWSDRNDPTYGKYIGSIGIESSNEFVIHHRERFGISAPTYTPQIDTWTVQLLGPHEIREGQGALWQGYILSNPEKLMDAETYSDELTQKRIRNLRAVKNGKPFYGGVGEAWGVCKELNKNNDWLCFGRFADVPSNPIPFMPEPLWGNTIWSPRQIGMSQTPGQTGGQEDFGSDKGSAATVLFQPSWITYFRAGLTDFYRYYNLFETDGSPLLQIMHPRRTTWNMGTHDATTRDFLGKAKYARTPPGNSFLGYDNEHRSQNNYITWYALTGNRAARKNILQAVETDLGQVPNRAGAEREIGRILLTWAKFVKVLDKYNGDKIKELMYSKHTNVKNQWRGRFFANDPTRTVRCLQIPVDARSGIYIPGTDHPDHTWIPYQTAMMVLGYYAFYKVTGDSELLDIIKQLCKTVLLNGVFKDASGVWHCLTFCRYRTGIPVKADGTAGNLPSNEPGPDEGLPLEASSYYVGSPDILIGDGGFWAWLAPSLIVAREVLDETDLKERAQEILNSVYPDKYPNWNVSEWMACGNLR